MTIIFKILTIAIILYCIIAFAVYLHTYDNKKSIFWICYLSEEIDLPTFKYDDDFDDFTNE